MFGKIFPQKSELRLREFDVYRAYYCAVCHSIKRRFGNVKRLTLSFDSVFLAMLLVSVSPAKEKDEGEEISHFRCALHPQLKKPIIKPRPEIDYAADMLIMLAYYNLVDDFTDDKNVAKRVFAAYVRAGRAGSLWEKYEGKAKAFDANLAELASLERANCPDISEVSEPFARILEAVFDYGGESGDMPPPVRAGLRTVGHDLGKWIYAIDALEDYKKDKKKNRYNPLASGGKNQDAKLPAYIANISEVIDLLPLKKNKIIIKNIIDLGLAGASEKAVAEFVTAESGDESGAARGI